MLLNIKPEPRRNVRLRTGRRFKHKVDVPAATCFDPDMATQAIPEMYDALIPSLVVSDGAKAIEFYKEVFGAQELMRMNQSKSTKIAHAEIKIRNHVLMLGDECPEMGALAPKPGGPPPPRSIMLYVTDVDATFAKALSKGATGTMPPTDMFWGDRYGKFMDPFGHLWGVATHTRDVSPEECAKAAAEWGKPKPA
jgi:PhnB protein